MATGYIRSTQIADVFDNAANDLAEDDVVCLTSSLAVKASAGDMIYPAMGIVESILDSTTCRVATFGMVELETSTITITPGQEYYLSPTSGTLATTLPTGSGERRQVVGVGCPGNNLYLVPYNADVLDSGKTRYTESFANQTTFNVTHSLGMYPVIEVLDSTDTTIVPSNVKHTSVDAVEVNLSSSQSGQVICVAGSDLSRPYDVNHVGTTKIGDGGTSNYLTVDSAGRVEPTGSAATEIVTYTCTTTEAVGDFVYISSENNVRQANATDNTTAPCLGIIVNKPTTTTCLVQRSGIYRNLSGLTAGTVYFLDTTAGLITATAPNSVGNIVQVIGRAKSDSQLELEIDVDAAEIVSISDERAVRWSDDNSRFELAPTAFSGIPLPMAYNLGNISTTNDTYVLGMPNEPFLEARGLALQLSNLGIRFKTSSPSSCALDMRCYIHRMVSGTFQDDEVFKIDWESSDISSGKFFSFQTEKNQSADDRVVGLISGSAKKVSNDYDASNKNTINIQGTAQYAMQKFKVPTSDAFTVSKVSLYVGYQGTLSAAALQCHIADLASDGTGTKPKVKSANTYRSLAQGSAEVAASSMTAAGVLTDFDFSANELYLKSGASFAIVVEPVANSETINTSNYFEVYRTTDSAYADGGSAKSTTSGETWGTVSSTDDLVFEVHGKTREGIFVKIIASGTSNIEQVAVTLGAELV